MQPRIMIIDGKAEFRSLLRHHVTTRWPGATVTEYDPAESGVLPGSFCGAGHHAVLLGDRQGNGDWEAILDRFLRMPGFPPLIYFSDRQPHVALAGTANLRLPRERIGHDVLVARLEALLGTDVGEQAAPVPHGAALADDDAPTVRGFRLLRRLADGEHAAVYLAIRETSDEKVALKILRDVADTGDGALDRFLQEFEIIAELDHPNIVHIYDIGISDDQAFLAMEYLPGGDMKQCLEDGITESFAMGVCRQIAHALANLHSVGILHRDLKPGNIMLRDDGSIALIDFGLAKRKHTGSEMLAGSQIFGTPHYMSPEQGRGADVDERSDLYSLGIIMYELLTGSRPFRGRDAMQIIFNHAEAPLPVLSGQFSRYQPLLDKLLAKKPQDRFQSAEELLSCL